MTELHRKYRPKTFDEVVGQDAVVKSLRALLKGEGSHAFVFTGPSGTGKTTLARIVASELGAEDLIEIDAATYTGVDAMRKIKETLRYAPMGGGARCLIVDEAHSLSNAAWQSVLKDVEEPSGYVYWMFCTTEAGKVPRTVETRCSCYALALVSSDDLYDLVERVARAEGDDPAEAVLGVVVDYAEGSPRRALTGYAQVRGIDDAKEAARVLRTAAEADADVRALAQALLKGAAWDRVAALVRGFSGKSPESVRIAVYRYMEKVALDRRSADKAGPVLEILSAFADPYPSTAGVGHLLLSVGEVLLGRD